LKEFYREFAFWVTLAIGVSLFVAGFNPAFKIAVARIPISGLREALAA
jgi:hypothetical protein